MLYLYNTVELIIQASSNFHFIFCFCNLIIFVLIAESSKPRSNRSVIHTKTVYPSSFRADYNGVISNPSSIKGSVDDHDAENDQHFADKTQRNVSRQTVDNSEEQEDSTETGSVEIQIYKELSPENEEVNLSFEELRNPEEVDDDDDDDDDDGDELKRKIDEFIAKEKLRINYELVIN